MFNKIKAYAVHLFTASGTVLAFWAGLLIYRGEPQLSFFVMALAVLVDSFDGTLARKADVTTYAPDIDGALMDNITDYLNWVFIPVAWAFMFLNLPFWTGAIVLVTSLLGFSHVKAKTDDNFFRGFPSYWNLVILYLYVLQASPAVSASIITIFAGLVLAPIKLIYPSRTPFLQKTTILLSIPYAIMIVFMLIYLRDTPLWLTLISFYYPVYYVVVSYMADKE